VKLRLRALAAMERHCSLVTSRDRRGIVDFAGPSREPRFHILNLDDVLTLLPDGSLIYVDKV